MDLEKKLYELYCKKCEADGVQPKNEDSFFVSEYHRSQSLLPLLNYAEESELPALKKAMEIEFKLPLFMTVTANPQSPNKAQLNDETLLEFMAEEGLMVSAPQVVVNQMLKAYGYLPTPPYVSRVKADIERD